MEHRFIYFLEEDWMHSANIHTHTHTHTLHFRPFARSHDDRKKLVHAGQDRGESGAETGGGRENFRSIRLSNRLIAVSLFFSSPRRISLSLSLCSFNSRYMHRGRGIRAMMPEGMRGAHKRHLYPLQLAEL